MNQVILEYLKKTYFPNAIIVYGSFANRTNDENSDFDALLVADKVTKEHDSSFVENIQLDVHIFSTEDIEKAKDLDRFIQVFDGDIVLDEKGTAKKLKERVINFIEENSKISDEEKWHLKSWCLKMLKRTKRNDIEGMYRWHWLLFDSLEIYSKMRGRFYFGPKKTLRWIEENDAEGYALVSEALSNMELLSLQKWINHVIKL